MPNDNRITTARSTHINPSRDIRPRPPSVTPAREQRPVPISPAKKANGNVTYVPSKGLEDWRLLLADPEKHWRRGYSAMELAECWERAHGFPPEVRKPLSRVFPEIRPLLIIPEHQVPIPGGARPSQNDIWILARSLGSLVSLAVEGKADESFGKPLGEWLQSGSAGKIIRWSFLKGKLGLLEEPDGTLMYQLFHRTASAIIQAEEFKAGHAVLIVHSFGAKAAQFGDYAAFLRLFGVVAAKNKLQSAKTSTPVPLHFLWATGKPSRHGTS